MSDQSICQYCGKNYFNKSSKIRHIKSQHADQQQPSSLSRQNHIICPICTDNDEVSIKTYLLLIQHLVDAHNIAVKETAMNFTCKEEFYNWMSQEKRDINFVVGRTVTEANHTYVYYNCNRSNCSTSGYRKKSANKRTLKAGGSIKIIGVCPARIIATFFDREVQVKYFETHVGHNEELRAQRLTKTEQESIADKLKSGVSSRRILQDVRKLNNNKLERLNLVNRHDLQYLRKKFNIDKRRNIDDMVAVSIKVDEWNSNGKNYAFLYKKIGESHAILKKEDFALGFMNASMEQKLRDFHKVICIDGTHGTNIKGFELTTIQVKDNKNAGFPVAFFLSNRQDQVIQEIYLNALKQRIGEDVAPEYLMTDDDGKYFNAWVKEMGNTPRRLLCTWHVVKNWNIKGKAKIKNTETKSTMKSDLYKIMTTLNTEEFKKLTAEYFDKLKEQDEMDFLKYLQKYYFQTAERIKMWAHCYRAGAGINTNMALESLHKFLKYNHLEGNGRVTVEKLLDTIDEIVDDKMWKTIANMERPTSNSYQDKTVSKAHRKAEESDVNNVEEIEYGKFSVKSSTGEKFYSVLLSNMVVCECQSVICKVCLICMHKYTCECAEYTIKNTICKHVHMVAMYERGRMDAASVLGTQERRENEMNNLCIEEPPETKIKLEDAITQFVEEKCEQNNETKEEELQNETRRKRRILLEKIVNDASALDDETFFSWAEKTSADLIKKLNEAPRGLMKRKMEKQSYFPKRQKQ